MAMNFYLPWAREIVLQERMPDDILFLGRFPLMPLFHAGLFSLLGFANWVIVLLPFFFASATAFLMYLWLSEKGVKKNYIIFGILSLLTSPLFLDVGMHPLQDPILLFFATAFFYYLEKFPASIERGSPGQTGRQNQSSYFYFLLLFLSAVLAGLAKETGLILFLPFGWVFIKNKLYQKGFYCCSLLLSFPLFLWLLRNYIIFDNPVFPILNGVFRGRYYDLISATNQVAGLIHSFLAHNGILTAIAEIPASFMLMFFPLIILSFYGFWKKGKFQYNFLFLIVPLFFIFIEPAMGDSLIRYSMFLLPLAIVYAMAGLEEVKSRIFLSAVFFFEIWGLFSTALLSSKSQFFSPVEEILSNFRDAAQFIYDYKLILAFGLGLFFFFLLSRNRTAKYLILLTAFMYFLKTEVFHIGSWLNVWLPILALIFIILIWHWISAKLKESALNKMIIAWVAALLLINGWGLAGAYSLAHNKSLAFPNFKEAYESRPEIADIIQKIEGENRDFYILAYDVSYFNWYTTFKTVQLVSQPFFLITNLEYRDDLDSLGIYNLFKRSKIKYILHKKGAYPSLDPFFERIESRPDLFEPLFRDGKVYLARVNPVK